MKTKIITAVLFCFFASVSFPQTDSMKTFYVNGQKVYLGKFYKLEISGNAPEYGKLIAVNKNSVLIYAGSSLAEFENEDIISMKESDGEIPDYSNYTRRPQGVKYKPQYSLSAGYSQKYSDYDQDYYYSYSNEYTSFNGFNLQGDMLIQTSDYFGFRVDVNYIHTFGRRTGGDNSYFNWYDTSTYRSETDYSDLNLLTLKSGILFGSIGRESSFSFYLYLGLGLGYTFGSGDISYQYKTNNNTNYTTVYTYTVKSYNEFAIGAHGSIRLTYRISNKYSLFFEPSFQYWSNNIERIINANGGITFHL